MQVSIQPTNEALVSVMTVSVPNSGLGARVERRLQEIQKTIRMDGFRPGKVPMNLVRQRYFAPTQAENLESMVLESFNQAVKTEQVAVAGLLGIDHVDVKDDTVSFEARYDVFPEVVLPDFSGLALEQSVTEISDADVSAMIEKLREMRKTFEVVEAEAQDGDMVNIDFVGSLDGTKFEGGSAQNVPLVLSSGRMIPGFEEGIVGMKAGETKTIDVTFPEAYQATNLAGKKTQFEITANTVQRASLPEVNAEFMTAFGITDGSIDTFKADVRSNLDRQSRLSLMRENRDRVLDALTTAVTFDVPQSLILRELEVLIKDASERGQAIPAKEEAMNIARERVTIGLLMAEIIKQNDLSPSEEKIREVLEIEAGSYDDPEQFTAWYLSDKQRRQQVESVVLEHAIVDLVFAKAKVTPVVKSLESLAG